MDQAEFLGSNSVQASLDGMEEVLSRWLETRLGGSGAVRVSGIRPPPEGSGYSAEIYFVDVERRGADGDHRERFVVRRRSAGRQMFPGRDFGEERAIQEVVGRLGAAPVPRIIGYEDDPEPLGERFYVMSLIPGRTPPTNPCYHQEGWLAELPPAARARLWLGALEHLGALHRRTLNSPDARAFSRAAAGRSDFAHRLDFWEAHYEASADGKALPLMTDIAAWLRANEPPETSYAICWGDARIGNILFDPDGGCVGMVDWELFSVGDPVQDLAYWLYNDDHFVSACGTSLAGWPSHAESTAAYERAAGITVEAAKLAFFRIYAGYWIVCTLNRLIQIKRQLGQLPADLLVDDQFTPVAFLRQEWAHVTRSGMGA